ncbi:MAG: hypothetical protein JOZ71_09830 [Ktedonobacteraceae bacterium]|nr:hypothetical protein [Ktedonobacteraceae bacterium]
MRERLRVLLAACFYYSGLIGLAHQWALTTSEETNTAQTDSLLLRRLPGDLDQHWLVQAAELVGLLGWSRFRKKA